MAKKKQEEGEAPKYKYLVTAGNLVVDDLPVKVGSVVEITEKEAQDFVDQGGSLEVAEQE